MPETTVGEGIVKIEPDVDREKVRRAAKRIADDIEGETKKRKTSIWKWLVTPNANVLQAIRTGVPAMFSSPMGIAAAVIGGGFALTFIAALLKTATVLVGGLGFIALGAFLLYKINEGFKKKAKSFAETLKGVANKALKPFIQPLTKAMDYVAKAAKTRLGPAFQRISKILGPMVLPLTKDLTKFVENTLPGFTTLTRGFGAALKGLNLPALGTAISDMFASLGKDPKLIQTLTGHISDFFQGLIKFSGKAIDVLSVFFGVAVNGWKAWGLLIDELDIGRFFDSFNNDSWKQVTAAWQGFWDEIQKVWGALREFAAADTDEEIKASAAKLWTELKVLWDKGVVLLKQAWNYLWGEIKRIWNTEVYPWLVSQTNKLWEELKKWAAQKWDELKETVKRKAVMMVLETLNALLQLPAKLPGILVTFGNLFVAGLAIAAVKAVAAAAKLVGKVVLALGKLPALGLAAIITFGPKIIGYLDSLKDRAHSAGYKIASEAADGIRDGLGIIEGAGKALGAAVAKYLPGSPVKSGPLRVLNDGYAGKQIVRMLASGILKERPHLVRTMNLIPSPLGAGLVAPGVSNIPLGGGRGVGSNASQGGTGTQNNFYQTFNVPNSDARLWAQEVGFELQNRM